MRGLGQRLRAEQTQVWSGPWWASEETWNSRWSLAAGAQVHRRHGSTAPGAQLSWEQECKAPGLRQKEAPSKRSDQLQWEEEATLWRPGRLPGLLPNRLDSRSIGRKGTADPTGSVLGLPWSCRGQHCWL